MDFKTSYSTVNQFIFTIYTRIIMKSFMLLLIAIVTIFTELQVTAKEPNVPVGAKQVLARMFPQAKSVRWEREGKQFEVNFKNDGLAASATFDVSGNLLETEIGIKPSELPKPALSYIADFYKLYKISEAAKITDSKGTITYEAEISKTKTKKDLIFDSNGKLIEKKEEKK